MRSLGAGACPLSCGVVGLRGNARDFPQGLTTPHGRGTVAECCKQEGRPYLPSVICVSYC